MATIKIRLTNGVEIPCFGASSIDQFYQGIRRDTITFYFDPEQVSLTSLVNAFTEDNCKIITIVDDDGEYVHENYQILDQIGTSFYSSVANGPVSSEADKRCLFARVIQTSLSERKLAQQDQILDDIIISMLEN